MNTAWGGAQGTRRQLEHSLWLSTGRSGIQHMELALGDQQQLKGRCMSGKRGVSVQFWSSTLAVLKGEAGG